MIRAAIHVLALATAASVFAGEPFAVSLDYSPGTDLSDQYRALVHAATARYRGDCDGTFVVERTTYIISRDRTETFETQHIMSDTLEDQFCVFHISPSGRRELLSEAHFLFDSFPRTPFDLRSSL
jgi:hypothetical protein